MSGKSLLKEKKVHVTDFRLAVLDIFDRYQNSVSQAQIEKELGTFDRITLYRTIKLFKEKGIIHEIFMSDNVKKLALCQSDCESDHHHHDHIHFHCEDCEEVYCLEIPQFPQINVSNFVINQVEIQASGKCNNCA